VRSIQEDNRQDCIMFTQLYLSVSELLKCLFRYNQKEEKILAWEVLEKSKAETELKKTEVYNAIQLILL
jgi:hypothetical protein